MSITIRRSTATPSQPDLETRVTNRKHELIAEIIEHKKSSRAGAPHAIMTLNARLTDLRHLMKESVAAGWANVDAGAAMKLDAWIAR
ncbi:MAG TPA: hypothetical protein VIV40_06115 [Kofleriaceae bacterium]